MTIGNDDDILKNIPDFMDDNDNATETPNDTTETQDTSNTTSPGNANTGGSADDTTGGKVSTTAAPTTPDAGVVQRRDGLIEVPNKDNPNARDLVDPATGEVIAKGGSERGLYERAQRAHQGERAAQQRAQQLEQRAIKAEAVAQQHTEVTNAVREAGIDHASTVTAVQLMGRFLKDPVSVLSDLVTEVKSKGYNIPFLETGVTPGMDAIAMQRMLDVRMAPITNAAQQQQLAERQQQEARSTLDNFLASEPDAHHNLGILGEMLTQEPSLNLNTAWSKLIRMSYEAGLNPTQPLKAQYEAKLRQQTTATPPAQAAQNTASRPLPNGRATNGAIPQADARQFDENSSMGDIIRQAMLESGFSVQR